MRTYTGRTIRLSDEQGEYHTLWELETLPDCNLDAYFDCEAIPYGLWTTLAPHQIGAFRWNPIGLVIDTKPLVVANVATLGDIIARNMAEAFRPEGVP